MSPGVCPPATTLEVPPADFGDCLLVNCPVGQSTWRMPVHTGPDETYPAALRRRRLQLAQGADGKKHIDLFVVRHIGHDRIGGARLFRRENALGLTVGDFGFNAPQRQRIRGLAEGQSLAGILGELDRRRQDAALERGVVRPACMHYGRGWRGGADRPGAAEGHAAIADTRSAQRSRQGMGERLHRKLHDLVEPERPPNRGAAPTIEKLAARVTPVDNAVP